VDSEVNLEPAGETIYYNRDSSELNLHFFDSAEIWGQFDSFAFLKLSQRVPMTVIRLEMRQLLLHMVQICENSAMPEIGCPNAVKTFDDGVGFRRVGRCKDHFKIGPTTTLIEQMIPLKTGSPLDSTGHKVEQVQDIGLFDLGPRIVLGKFAIFLALTGLLHPISL